MNIKEAGRYANFLNNLINELKYFKSDFIYKTVELHLKNKVNSTEEDEEIEVVTNNKLDCQLDSLVHLIFTLIEEKLQLALAIDQSKKTLFIDWKENGKFLSLDSAIEYNTKTRSFIESIKELTQYKSSESMKKGIGQKFNVEGNQVNYSYDIKVVKTINYDKDTVTKLYRKLLDKTDNISNAIDKAMLLDSVDFVPNYSLHDTTEDVIALYLSSRA